LINFNNSIWSARDPDNILLTTPDSINENCFGFGKSIHPREDLLQFTNLNNEKIIDFGFYGDEIELNGKWIVFVVISGNPDAWYNPLERYEFKEFIDGVGKVQELLNKYT